MKMRWLLAVLVLVSAGVAYAGEGKPEPPPPPEKPIGISDVKITGDIEGENITFVLDVIVATPEAGRTVKLVTGDIAIEKLEGVSGSHRLLYDKDTYSLWLAKSGSHPIRLTFAARPKKLKEGWRECSFTLPLSDMRQLEVTSDRPDLEITFPGAMRVKRVVENGSLRTTAIVGFGNRFFVRWKPKVQELTGKLVAAAQVSTIATVSSGALRLEATVDYRISQGEAKMFQIALPSNLSVTQVIGPHIQDWRVEEAENKQTLTVTLAQRQRQHHTLRIQGELTLDDFPAEFSVPVIEPLGTIRASGQVAVGTDSAVHLKVGESAGLTQIDMSMFRRIQMAGGQPQPLPARSVFLYSYAATPYRLALTASDMRPWIDATHRVLVQVRDDDLIVTSGIELIVRDAPVRELKLALPAGFAVADVAGNDVVLNGHEVTGEGAERVLTVPFKKPVKGRTLLTIRLEIGASPLDRPQAISGLDVADARSERGSISIVPEAGIQVEVKKTDKLHTVHAASVKMADPRAQIAHKFRLPGWSLELLASRKPSSMRSELFHLASVGEGIVYGSTTINFFITGSPIGELKFRLPEGLRNVEFTGREVQGQKLEDGVWTVTLRRRTLGEYTLLVTSTQPYKLEGGPVTIGGIECLDVDTQVGYIAVASSLNLILSPDDPKDFAKRNLLVIDHDELPFDYRRTVNAPILRAFKYVRAPHSAPLSIRPYKTGDLLGVVIDLMELRTAVSPEGEARTTATYQVKNSNAQFLALEMPPGSRVWSVELITRVDKKVSKQRVVTSQDAKGNLLIPLERRRDPNVPTELAVTYSEAGQHELGLAHAYTLVAPRPQVTSTYSRWEVTAPKDFEFDDVASNLAFDEPEARQPGLSPIGINIARLYAHTATLVAKSPIWILGAVALAAIVIVLVVGIVRVRWLGSGIITVVAVLWLAFGVWALIAYVDKATVAEPPTWKILGAVTLAAIVVALATGIAHVRWLVGINAVAIVLWVLFGVSELMAHVDKATVAEPPAKTGPVLTFTQTLNPSGIKDDGGKGVPELRIEAGIVPSWAAGLFSWRTIPIAIVTLWLLIMACIRRRWRKLFIGLALAGALCVISAVPAARKPLELALVVALPLIPFLFVSLRLSIPARPLASAALVLLLVLPLGCAGLGITPPPSSKVMDEARFTLKAEKDSLDLEQRFVFRLDEPATIPVLWTGAALIQVPDNPDVAARMTESGCVLDVKRAGRYDVTLKFLVPLKEAEPDQARAFELTVPRAIQSSAQLVVPGVNLDVTSATAVKLNKTETKTDTTIDAVLGPGDKLAFQWRPRARSTELEKTVFFTNVLSSVQLRAGVVESRHVLHFQIAQGELKEITVELPEGMAVTSVNGADLGTWLYDRANRRAEIRLAKPAVGQYLLLLVTQATQQKLPYEAEVGVPLVVGAGRQRGAIGVYPSRDVRIEVSKHPAKMNVEDYARAVLGVLRQAPWANFGPPRYAYRYRLEPGASAPSIAVSANRVAPELRSTEEAYFSVADDRLVYNARKFTVAITKAGRFSVDLNIPPGYDIDDIKSSQMSHWDEEERGGQRIVTIHFNRRLRDAVAVISIALSRTLDALPPELTVPRIELVDSLKHTGQVTISSERGVQLSVKERSGVSHVRAQLGASKDALTYKLLRRDWQLVLEAERIEPRLEVDFLHIAEVSEGLVRGTTHLTYSVKNAGVKAVILEVPKDLTGLVISGADIARTQEVEEGSSRWRVELKAKKQHIVLEVQYERRFENDTVSIRPVRDVDAELQRGYIVVRTHQKVQVTPEKVDLPLKATDARGIPRPQDLSDAALCYQSSSADAELRLKASRHAAADILPATVSGVDIETVVTTQGHQISWVRMALHVGSKRLLRATLPPKSALWTLSVNGRPVAPSVESGPGGALVHLIPLGRARASGEPTPVSFVYITPRRDTWQRSRQGYDGPQFDLPLQNVRWTFFLPEAYRYSDFDGTLRPDEETVRAQRIAVYRTEDYVVNVRNVTAQQKKTAEESLTKGRKLKQEGKNWEAQAAFNDAFYYSMPEKGTHEDARVALEKFQREETVDGLANRRALLRQRHARGLLEGRGEQSGAVAGGQGRGRLSLDDQKSMDAIGQKMFGQQVAAQPLSQRLKIDLARRGRVIAFERNLQVRPDVEMNVSFDADPPLVKSHMIDYVWALGIAVVAVFGLATVRRTERPEPPRPPAPPAPEPVTPPEPELPPEPERPMTPPEDDENDRVIEDVPVE